jgi:hypothetical protein
MKIESPLQYKGTREMISRFRESLATSAKYMDEAAYNQLDAQISREIAVLENAVEDYRREQNLDILTKSWFTLRLTTEGVQQVPLPESVDIKTENLSAHLTQLTFSNSKKPVISTGFSLALAGF